MLTLRIMENQKQLLANTILATALTMNKERVSRAHLIVELPAEKKAKKK
jgi:hypothetical protein